MTLIRPWSIAVIVAGVVGCSSATETIEAGAGSEHIAVRTGQAFDVVLQTIGFGEYSTPAISTSAVKFLDVEQDGSVVNPGGPRQRFHFAATAPGSAIITFNHTGMNVMIQDTITVR